MTKVDKGEPPFALDFERLRMDYLTNSDAVANYYCKSCHEAKRPHEIVRQESTPTTEDSCWGPGIPSFIRVCTGCQAQDGPWVDATLVDGR